MAQVRRGRIVARWVVSGSCAIGVLSQVWVLGETVRMSRGDGEILAKIWPILLAKGVMMGVLIWIGLAAWKRIGR